MENKRNIFAMRYRILSNISIIIFMIVLLILFIITTSIIEVHAMGPKDRNIPFTSNRDNHRDINKASYLNDPL